MRRVGGLLVVSVMGCAPCKRETPRETPTIAVDSAIEAAVDAGGPDAALDADASVDATETSILGRCFEPKTIVKRDVKTAKATLASDPLTPTGWHDWQTDDEKMIVHFSARTYEVVDALTIVATEGAKEVWRTRVDPLQVIAVGVSPAGRVVAVKYLRGFEWQLLDATTGASLTRAQPGVLFAPDDSFALEVPRADRTMDEANAVYATPSVVTWTLDASSKPTVLENLPLKDDTDDAAFGGEICPTGATIVVSFPSTELAVYRAKDGAKLASIAKPGDGSPVFSRSGRFVALMTEGHESTLFELLP